MRLEEITEKANSLISEKKYLEAEKLINEALSNGFEDITLYTLLGLSLHFQGRYEDAISAYQEALNFNPKDPGLYNLLGTSLRMLGRREEAKKAFDMALEIKPDFPEALNNLGNLYRDLGKIDEAIECYKKAISYLKDSKEIRLNLSLCYADIGNLAEAEKIVKEILSGDPGFYPARKILAGILNKQKKLSQAEDQLRFCLILNPNDVEIYNELANLLLEMNPPIIGEAEILLEKALRINPNFPGIYHCLGLLSDLKGEKEKAMNFYKKAIELRPYQPVYYRMFMQRYKPKNEKDPYILRLKEILEKPLSLYERFEALLSLAYAKRNMGDEEGYFELLIKANQIKKNLVQYNREELEKSVRNRLRIFTKERIKKLSGYGFPSEQAVFIIGMPRSGTTLLETMLGSHPDIYAAGELKILAETLRKGIFIEDVLFIHLDKGDRIPEQVLKAPEGFFEIGKGYSEELRRISPFSKKITDKMPGNFFYLPIILLSLPDAKVIHIRRHPLDTLVSCFEQPFTEGHEWSYDLEDLAHYFNHYFILSKHFESLFPQILKIDYEELVFDPEGTLKKIFDYLEIPFSEECLRFYEKRKIVATASLDQVRRPIYREGIKRYRKYQKFLDPLLKRLHPLVIEEIRRLEEKY